MRQSRTAAYALKSLRSSLCFCARVQNPVSHFLPSLEPSSCKGAAGISLGLDTRVQGFAASAERDLGQGASIGPCESCESENRSPDGLFCNQCGNLQPLNLQQSYFNLMQQPENSFKLNHSHLDQRFKDLQRKLHPDKFSNSDTGQQDISAAASARVNDAFTTLKNPIKRAEYLLQMKGEEIKEDAQADPDLLMTIMEARESVEETKDLNELSKLANVFRKQEDDCIKEMENAFNREDLERAKTLLGVMRYLANIQAAIQERL